MALTDRAGRFVRVRLKPGNAAEVTELSALLDDAPTNETVELLGDKTYDSRAVRAFLASKKIIPTIPQRSNWTEVIRGHFATPTPLPARRTSTDCPTDFAISQNACNSEYFRVLGPRLGRKFPDDERELATRLTQKSLDPLVHVARLRRRRPSCDRGRGHVQGRGDGDAPRRRNGGATPQHGDVAPHEAAALIRQHHSINSPAEVNDLQFIANQDGITLDESVERYAWRDDFSKMVTAIEDEDPDSVVDAGSGKPGRLSAWINFSGSISGNARRAIDKFKSENPHVTVSLQTGKDPGFTRREADEAVVGAHFAVMAEDGVQDSVTFYDSDAIAIIVTVQMATPPSGEKLSSLEKAAERGAAAATRPDITDSLAISLSVVQHDITGTDGSRAPN